jgi:predicted DNA-binding transcriptional regulator AlpA
MRRKQKAPTNQLDFFSNLPVIDAVSEAQTRNSKKDASGKIRARIQKSSVASAVQLSAVKSASSPAESSAPKRISASAAMEASKDEWWTSEMVCTFLKISRKTLWQRRRNLALDFPRATHLGGSRNFYRASAIKAWAESMVLQFAAE